MHYSKCFTLITYRQFITSIIHYESLKLEIVFPDTKILNTLSPRRGGALNYILMSTKWMIIKANSFADEARMLD